MNGEGERKLSFASMAMWARRRFDERECQRQPPDAISGKGGVSASVVKGGPGQHEVKVRKEKSASKVQADSQSWCQTLREGSILPESCRGEREKGG